MLYCLIIKLSQFLSLIYKTFETKFTVNEENFDPNEIIRLIESNLNNINQSNPCRKDFKY